MYEVVVKRGGVYFESWVYNNELYAKMIALKWNDMIGYSAEIYETKIIYD